jgi:hypothetical protein
LLLYYPKARYFIIQINVFPEEHDAISEKQDEVAWNATTGTLTGAGRDGVIEILLLWAKLKNVRPDLVVLG